MGVERDGSHRHGRRSVSVTKRISDRADPSSVPGSDFRSLLRLGIGGWGPTRGGPTSGGWRVDFFCSHVSFLRRNEWRLLGVSRIVRPFPV